MMPTSGIVPIPCAAAEEGVVQLPADLKRPSKLLGAWARRAARRKVLEHVALGHGNRVVQRKSPPLVRRDNQPANRGKREEMRQRTRGGVALIGRGCGGGRVERTRGGGVDTTTSRQTRDNHGGGEGEGEGGGDGKCRATAITGLGEHLPRSLRLRLWLRSRQ